MPDFPKFGELFRVGRDEALVRNAKISREMVEREGTDANILVASSAAMADEVSGQLTDLDAALFLDSAVGQVLDRLVFDRYGMTRKPAAAAIGSANFYTATAAPATFSIPLNTLLQTASGVQYLTSESAVYPAGSAGPVVVAVRSAKAGADQAAKIGTITSIAGQISGSPANLTVRNTLATTGADDAEQDDALRARARNFFVTARRGTMKALEAAALNVPGVRQAVAFEYIDGFGRPTRSVQLVVTDAFTEQFADYSTVPPLYQAQSQAISANVVQALADVRPAGTYVRVYVANVILQPMQLTLAFTAGANVNDSALAARAAVVAYVNGLEPGATLSASAMLSKLQNVAGLAFTGGELLSPVGDVVPQPLQVIRASLALVSAVAAQTDQPIVTGSNPDSYGAALG